MARKSKAQLFKDLQALANEGVLPATFSNVETAKLKHRCIDNETYGRDSRVYVNAGNAAVKNQLLTGLERMGHNVNRNYGTNGTTVEVGVTYFKGVNWNE